MKNFLLFLLSLCLVSGCTKFRDLPINSEQKPVPDSLSFGSLLINEYTPKSKVDTNEFGIPGKWFEIYNPGKKNIEIDTNFYLTDTLGLPNKFQVPLLRSKQIVPAQGYLVIWTDNCDTISNGRLIHTNFSLNSSGGAIAIFIKKPDGEYFPIDTLSYSDHSLLPKGTPIGRYPDGSVGFKQLSIRTPGNPNKL